MDDKPLLIFPRPSSAERSRLYGGGKDINYPSRSRQDERLSPQFQKLQQFFKPGNVSLQADAGAAPAEHVLVLETVGKVDDFVKAVKRIDSLEWLLESLIDGISADDDFYIDEDKAKDLSGMLFLIGANQEGMRQLISLWNRYIENPEAEFPYGLARFRYVFEQLKTIRTWDYRDRFRETGAYEDWRLRVKHNQASIPFETELWYRKDTQRRTEAETRFKSLIRDAGGEILQTCVIDEIRYHGVLAKLPADDIKSIVDAIEKDETSDVKLIHCDDVMFFRPVGQVSFKPSEEESQPDPSLSHTETRPSGEPIVALFDGLPLENHVCLKDHIIVDDPDDWSMKYRPQHQEHGTAMASLIVCGELSVSEPRLDRPIYVRPVLVPDEHGAEKIPETTLAIDLTFRSIRRLFEGANGGVARNVKIVNLSLGDPSRLLDHHLSPWARLIDWLSYEYNVLFVVSTGNHDGRINLGVTRREVDECEDGDLQKITLRALISDSRYRRLLSPAEAINALTVGALHSDGFSATSNGSTSKLQDGRVDLLGSTELPSPLNAFGLGFARAVKPELLLPGGRLLYRERPGPQDSEATFVAQPAPTKPPGLKVASPGPRRGQLNGTKYVCGTSNAAALATRTGARIYEVIQDLKETGDWQDLHDDYIAVLIKALLVHSADWREAEDILNQVLASGQSYKDNIARLLGYGMPRFDKVMNCTDQRATILGVGSLERDEGHVYELPLPPSLSGERTWRRLTITLAYFSPINSAHSKYRRASLWFTPPMDPLKLNRTQAHAQTVRRGTVQHEILEGERASPYVDEETLSIKVNCRSYAGKLETPVRYALATTLEVAPESKIPIYEEIRTRIRPAVRVSVKTQ